MAKSTSKTEPAPEVLPPTFADERPDERLPDEVSPPSGQLVPASSSHALMDANCAENLNLAGLRLPYLSITHGVGDAAATFNPGDLVLAKENLVCPKGKTIEAIILNLDQYFRQYLTPEEYKSGASQASFKTLDDAAAAGFRTQWETVGGCRVGPDVRPALDLTLLLRKPEGLVCSMFCIEIGDGHEYAMCKFTADKTCHDYVINDIGLILRTKLRKTGSYSGLWTLRTEFSRPAKNTGNRVQIARFGFKEMLSPDVVKGIVMALSASA